jgi:hypothetical protein
VFVAATEAFSRKNINCLDRRKPRPRAAGFTAREGTASACAATFRVVLGCPYEGDVDPARVRDVAEALYAMGSYEVSLGDTIGTLALLPAGRNG